jgi:hypothetical protein
VNGNKWWYQNGELHRLDGPAIEYIDGHKEWYQNGKLHRLDGPAIEHAKGGNKYWYQNDKLHRLDGPAVEYSNGVKWWFIEGTRYTEEEFNKKINLKQSCDGKIVEIEGIKYKLKKV